MGTRRKSFSPNFKAREALAATGKKRPRSSYQKSIKSMPV
jgi:hypothetical protein